MNQFEKLGFALAKSADNNRWLNDFDRTNTVFGSGIKRWLNQPGGFFGPPKVGWPRHASGTADVGPYQPGLTYQPGSRWVANQAGLTHQPTRSLFNRTHEDANTQPFIHSFWANSYKAPTPRTPTAIGRWLGATQGLSTPATAERIKELGLNKRPLTQQELGLNKRSVDQTGIADWNRWLNDFDRTNTIFGSGIKRWLNQPGGYFGPPVVPVSGQFDLAKSPAGSRWVADQAGLGWRADQGPENWGRTHEEWNTESSETPLRAQLGTPGARPPYWFKISPPRTPTTIGRMLGATQGLSTPATAKRIKKMQKPVPPVIRYPSSRPKSPAPVPATAK